MDDLYFIRSPLVTIGHGEGFDVLGFFIHSFPSKKTKKGVRNMYKAPKIRTSKAVKGYLYSLCIKSLKLFSITYVRQKQIQSGNCKILKVLQ